MKYWIEAGRDLVSLAILPIDLAYGRLRAAVARLRRACRDIRDRAARRHTPWRRVAMAGMALGEGAAWLLIRHPGITRHAVTDLLCRRWPNAAIRDASTVSPPWRMSVEVAIELARIRRGVEPLRVVVLPQRVCEREGSTHKYPCAEPMPIVF
jgi:hypothetical protein